MSAIPTAPPALHRAAETKELIDAVCDLVVPFIRAADEAVPAREQGGVDTARVLVNQQRPEELVKKLSLELPADGQGRDGLLDLVRRMLAHSVNTWDQGFLDKLYASTTPVGVVAEMLLAVLNTNLTGLTTQLHVYQVSPALTIVEKTTARQLAALFGFDGPRAGGVTCPGGSASNMTSLVMARNIMFPQTKTEGNGNHRFAIFTGANSHYSVAKSAVSCGLGSDGVVIIPIDTAGRMRPDALDDAVLKAKEEGRTPLYVNATAGSTVMGSYDPLEEVGEVCRRHGLWMHVDASWGGPVVFSRKHRHLLAGSSLANSVTINPHKMLNVPVTCSFLLGPDMAVFHRANTQAAGYLFHGPDDIEEHQSGDDQWDLADLTMQCGRKGDSLKLALAWTYYGARGFEERIDGAFALAVRLAARIGEHADLVLLSDNPPPCLQVCFYYAPGKQLADDEAVNTSRTRRIVACLIGRGFMVDHAPGDRGNYFRVVVNMQTLESTMDGLLRAVEEVGREVVVLTGSRV